MQCAAALASAAAKSARPWAPMFVALAAEVLVRETGDVVSMLRDYEGNSDVRIGVYRAISSASGGAVDLSSESGSLVTVQFDWHSIGI